jgi:hypothetical protein
MSTISGSGGAKTISVPPGDKLVVNNFGGFGTGSTPAAPGELDTLHFLGAIMTPGNMVDLIHVQFPNRGDLRSRQDRQWRRRRQPASRRGRWLEQHRDG